MLAKSEDDARKKVMLATGIGTRVEPGLPIRTSPWWRGDLTDCVADNTPGRKPPPGKILTHRGTLTIPGTRSAN